MKNVFVLKFKLSAEKVERCFSGERIVLKKSLSKIHADKLKSKLLGVGVEALIVPSIGISDANDARVKNQRHEQLSK
ncbi:MAG: hypothetical protein ACJAS9_002215 [Polaribacter sp.]